VFGTDPQKRLDRNKNLCIVKARKRKGRFVRSILMYSGTGFGSTGFGSTGFGSTGFQPVEGVPPGSGSIQEKG